MKGRGSNVLIGTHIPILHGHIGEMSSEYQHKKNNTTMRKKDMRKKQI